jgi:hypothetical protein
VGRPQPDLWDSYRPCGFGDSDPASTDRDTRPGNADDGRPLRSTHNPPSACRTDLLQSLHYRQGLRQFLHIQKQDLSPTAGLRL